MPGPFAHAPMDGVVPTALPGEFLPYPGNRQLEVMNSVLTTTASLNAYARGLHIDGEGRNTLPFPLQASRTTTSSVIVQTKGATGVIATINVTDLQATTPSLILSIEGYDPSTASFYTILADAAVATVTSSSISIAPGLPATANVSIPAVLPDTIRVTVSHGDTDTVTYAVYLDWQD